MSRGAVVFLSDAHLGADPVDVEAEREARLHRFLEQIPGNAGSLVIVGDLFDFWFEYRSAIPRRHFRTLAALRRVVESGVAVTMINGNHDFYLGRFLEETVGVHTTYDAQTLELQGRRLWVHHGDGLMSGDLGYKLLKKVLRNPVNVALYQLIHPDLGIPLAGRVSRWSRGSREHRRPELEALWRVIAMPRFAEGYDAVILGHFHDTLERRENGRELFVLGDWITRFTYLVLEDGRLTMRTWDG